MDGEESKFVDAFDWAVVRLADVAPEDLSEEELAAFLESHPATVDGVDFHFHGFPNEEAGRDVMNAAMGWISMFSRFHPLQGLDGVTYAADYAKALAELDRGIPTNTTLTASMESFGQGVAMSPAVRRDGKLKTHVVIAAKLGLDLLSENEQDRELAIHTLAHELGGLGEPNSNMALEDRADGQGERLPHFLAKIVVCGRLCGVKKRVHFVSLGPACARHAHVLRLKALQHRPQCAPNQAVEVRLCYQGELIRIWFHHSTSLAHAWGPFDVGTAGPWLALRRFLQESNFL